MRERFPQRIITTETEQSLTILAHWSGAKGPTKRRKTRRKLQILTSLTIYFSCKSDEYSIIYKPLKIKFQKPEFQKFLEIIEFSRKFREIEKCSDIGRKF